RQTWKSYQYNAESFVNTMIDKSSIIESDILSNRIDVHSSIINGDVRKVLNGYSKIQKFKLCITSPPYLNTFDYCDIYRLDLFLGKFVYDNQELYDLRLKTVRSHVQAKWHKPVNSDFGTLYQQSIKHINDNKELLM